MFLFLIIFRWPGFEQDRGRERKVISRSGRIETARFQEETDLLACESNLFRRENPSPATIFSEARPGWHSLQNTLLMCILLYSELKMKGAL